MKLNLTILSIAAALLSTNEGRAQSGFAASEISRLQLPSSPANFTADRQRSQLMNNSVPRFGLQNVNAGAVSNALGRANKPFSSISKGPSVTPYLALDNPFTSPATSYYTQIRPQMEQQQINQQQQRQNQTMQRQISQYTALQPYDPTGSEARAPTGHASVYMITAATTRPRRRPVRGVVRCWRWSSRGVKPYDFSSPSARAAFFLLCASALLALPNPAAVGVLAGSSASG